LARQSEPKVKHFPPENALGLLLFFYFYLLFLSDIVGNELNRSRQGGGEFWCGKLIFKGRGTPSLQRYPIGV
jgi:hypothetical protein